MACDGLVFEPRALLARDRASARCRPTRRKTQPRPPKLDSGKAAPKAAQAKPEAGKTADCSRGGERPPTRARPARSPRTKSFGTRGPRSFLGMEKLKTVPAKPVGQNEILDLKAQAGGSNANIDKDVNPASRSSDGRQAD